MLAPMFKMTLFMPGDDARLKAVMEGIQKAGLKLNERKCVFANQWKLFVFLGYLFSQEGVKPDPTKIEAIRDIPTLKYGVGVRVTVRSRSTEMF